MFIPQEQRLFMLSSKNKAYLKSYAHSHDILKFNIGKDLIDHNVIKTLSNGLEKYELIKVAFLKSSVENEDLNELILDLSSNLNAEVIQKIGKTIILYRENKKSLYHITF